VNQVLAGGRVVDLIAGKGEITGHLGRPGPDAVHAAGATMVTKLEKTEHLICDLCGQETTQDQMVTLYRTDNKISAAKMAASALMRTESGKSGQANVDICPACWQRPVGEVLTRMYPARASIVRGG
jgi:hypothetical protein